MIGDLVKTLRGDRSIRQMAKDTNVAASYISMMEKDSCTPSLEVICKLVKYSPIKDVTVLDFVNRIYKEV